MRLKILAENTASAPYCGEHGLCIYTETKTHKMLLDTGKSGLFIENAKIAGIDISSVDTVFISHGHYDHTGGIRPFLTVNKTARIFINRHAFDGLYSLHGGEFVFIGTDAALRSNPQVVLTDGDYSIDGELSVFRGIKTNEFASEANRRLFEKHGEEYIEDRFLSEQNFVINEDGKRVLYAGCSHLGIVNIINRFIEKTGEPPAAVFGGFHLMIPSEGRTVSAEVIRGIAKRLDGYPTRYYTGHCTGAAAFDMLKEILGEKIRYISTGDEIII